MQTILIIMLVLALLIGSLLMAWLDAKKGWQLNAWINGKVENPFVNQQKLNHLSGRERSSAEKERLVAELTERVQILEKIVTEPAYELNQKLNRL